MGRGGAFRRPAGAAVSTRRPAAALASRVCVVRAGSAAVRDPVQVATKGPRPLRRGFLLGYLCGFLWYMGNCYWIRDTMAKYGDLPAIVPVLLLIGFSLVLGLYFGLFGLGVALVRQGKRKHAGSGRRAHLLGRLELAASRITSVPWDQLGYSQVDNALVNQLAPWTGVYGISFVLVAVNALIAGGLMIDRCPPKPFWQGPKPWGIAGVALMAWHGVVRPISSLRPRPAPTATAVLIQPNLDVAGDNRWSGPGEWDQHIAEFTQLAGEQCKTYIAGIPQTGASDGEIVCPPYPRTPTWWRGRSRPRRSMRPTRSFRRRSKHCPSVQAPLVVGNIGWTSMRQAQEWHYYNSALVVGADGARVGRYDKIHLVPFGEYIPFQNLLTFAHKLTGRVSKFTRGDGRKVFRLPTSNGRPSLRRLHLLRVGVCRRNSPVCAARRRGAGQHQRRRLVRRHQRALAAPEHGAHAGHRKPPLDSARHQQRRDGGHRPLRPRAPEHSPPPDRRAPRPVRLPRRHHLLHRPRRRVWLAVRAICGSIFDAPRLRR
jgi:apolipoprotein N-acyltransferase